MSLGGGGTDYEGYIQAHGGVGLVVAIEKYVWADGESQVRIGSGLGGSSAVWVGKAKEETGLEGEELVLEAERREKGEGGLGGRQDYWACVFGGMQWLEFGQDWTVRRYEMAVPEWLENGMMLVDVGARSDNRSVADQLNRDNNELLHMVKMLAHRMRWGIETDRGLDFVGACMDYSFAAKVMLTPFMVTEEVGQVYALGKMAGACGGRLMGAGGGGYMLFLCQDDKWDDVYEAMFDHGYRPERVVVDRVGASWVD